MKVDKEKEYEASAEKAKITFSSKSAWLGLIAYILLILVMMVIL